MVKGQRENYNSVRPPYVIIQYVSLIFFFSSSVPSFGPCYCTSRFFRGQAGQEKEDDGRRKEEYVLLSGTLHVVRQY